MSDSQISELADRVRDLSEENAELRQKLSKIEERAQSKREASATLGLGGLRLLIPLFDRQKVVRSFGKLAQTMSGFAGPNDDWPTREAVLDDARVLMESCVRFAIRRRTLWLVFTLLATTIPAVQIWLVVQQNEIIENQNEFFEIQVYDIVARSMTEGDRNARLMTGALLANADLQFLRGVVDETFDPAIIGVMSSSGVQARGRRLEDAAFRGYLVRAVSRGVEVHARRDDVDDLFTETRPMFRRILRDDARDRVPEVLRFGRQADGLDDELAEQVDNYLGQIGGALRVYGRLARSEDELEAFYEDITPLLRRLASRRTAQGNRFGETYQAVLQDFLFEMAVGPELGDPSVSLEAEELSPEQAIEQGIAALRQGVGEDTLDWTLFAAQVSAP